MNLEIFTDRLEGRLCGTVDFNLLAKGDRGECGEQQGVRVHCNLEVSKAKRVDDLGMSSKLLMELKEHWESRRLWRESKGGDLISWSSVSEEEGEESEPSWSES